MLGPFPGVVVLIFFIVCLLTEPVSVSMSRSSHRRGASAPPQWSPSRKRDPWLRPYHSSRQQLDVAVVIQLALFQNFSETRAPLSSRMRWLRIGRIGAPAALSAGCFCFTAAPTCRTESFCSALAPPWRRDHHRPSGGIPPPWQCPPGRLGHCSTSFPRDKIRDGSSS